MAILGTTASKKEINIKTTKRDKRACVYNKVNFKKTPQAINGN